MSSNTIRLEVNSSIKSYLEGVGIGWVLLLSVPINLSNNIQRYLDIIT